MTQKLAIRTTALFLVMCTVLAGTVMWSQASAQGRGDASQSITSKPQATAAAFIKFDGVDGESQDKDHKDWSTLISFSQEINPDLRRGGSHGEVVVTKELDKSSPKLAEAIARGKVFPEVTFELTRNYPGEGKVVYLKYELKDVIISSYNVDGESRGHAPSETLSLNYEEIKVTYTEVDSKGQKKGNVEYHWKVEEGAI